MPTMSTPVGDLFDETRCVASEWLARAAPALMAREHKSWRDKGDFD